MRFGESFLYYIIEHPTRGVLKYEENPNTGKPSFSWSGLRNDDRMRRFRTIEDAKRMLRAPDMPEGCHIRASQWKTDGLNDAWPIVIE